MRKAELVSALADKTGLTKSQALAATDGIISIITDAAISGAPIFIRGFATIKPVTLAARKGRDISNGKTIDVAARRSVKLVLSKTLKSRLNP